ncbi:MAG: glycosyltransferase family 1 protein [Anaerolineae bacterium]
MHIVFDMTFPARNRSGVGVYGRELLAALRREAPPEFEIEEFCAAGPASKPDMLRKLADGAAFMTGVELGLPLHLWRRRPDLLHAPAFIAPLLPLGCRLVITCHDTILEDGWQAFHPAWRLFHRLSLRRGLRQAAAILTPSQQAARDLARVYGVGAAHLHVIPHGCNPIFRPVAAEGIATVLTRLGVRAPFILNVGAQVERKNLVRLLEAFDQVRRGRSGLTLVLVGPPGNASLRVQQTSARLDLHDPVTWLPAVTDGELAALYSGAAAFAFPSLAEGFGLPILEAQACGAVVVTSDRGAMAEVAGGAALLADPTRVDALAEALEQALGDQALAAHLREQGMQRAATFTWERCAQATLAVYQQVTA